MKRAKEIFGFDDKWLVIIGIPLTTLVTTAKLFFRINRQAIVKPEAIRRISAWFNSRLKLELSPVHETNNVVSRERVQDFKRWMGQ